MDTQHNWYGVSRHLRLVPKSEQELEHDVAANRERFDTATVPMPARVPVGGGVMRKVSRIARSTWRYLIGSRP